MQTLEWGLVSYLQVLLSVVFCIGRCNVSNNDAMTNDEHSNKLHFSMTRLLAMIDHNGLIGASAQGLLEGLEPQS